jgi:hypothetical protein
MYNMISQGGLGPVGWLSGRSSWLSIVVLSLKKPSRIVEGIKGLSVVFCPLV